MLLPTSSITKEASTKKSMEEYLVETSIIIPVKNGEQFLCECFDSILSQINTPSIEVSFCGHKIFCLTQSLWFSVSIYDDGSNDGTMGIINQYQSKFQESGMRLLKSCGETSGGVGYAKNKAVKQSNGRFLCFLDADDTMHPRRISKQYEKALQIESNGKLAFVGSCFERIPPSSTERYTRWACNLTNDNLYTQIYTAFGPTLIAPTWFISRKIYDTVGGFDEEQKGGFPEDLDFFYKALPLPIQLSRINDPLLIYRYHPACATFSVHENTIWDIRIKEIEKNVLPFWPEITIWNAGKQGKKLYKSLSPINQSKVIAFCDVDEKKIKRNFYEVYDNKLRKVAVKIPIISYKMAQPKCLIAVKLEMSDFEEILKEKQWKESFDYVLFS